MTARRPCACSSSARAAHARRRRRAPRLRARCRAGCSRSRPRAPRLRPASNTSDGRAASTNDGCCEHGIAGLRRFVGGIGERGCHRRRRRRGDSARSIARASASVMGSGTVGPDPITAGSSPGTSEIASVTSRAGLMPLGQAAALDAREMLAHGVDLGDRRARCEQRAGQRLLLGEREARRRRDPVRGRAARHQHERQDRPARRHRRATGFRKVAAKSRPHRGPDGRLRSRAHAGSGGA